MEDNLFIVIDYVLQISNTICVYLVFMHQIILHCLHSASALSFYIDVILTFYTSNARSKSTNDLGIGNKNTDQKYIWALDFRVKGRHPWPFSVEEWYEYKYIIMLLANIQQTYAYCFQDPIQMSLLTVWRLISLDSYYFQGEDDIYTHW